MPRSTMTAGFQADAAPVASRRLANAVAASLAVAALSICLCVGLMLASLTVPLVG